MDMDKALGLPSGSVRAILAFGLTACLLYFIYLKYTIPEQLWTIVGMLIAFYFGTSAGKSKTIESEPTSTEEIVEIAKAVVDKAVDDDCLDK